MNTYAVIHPLGVIVVVAESPALAREQATQEILIRHIYTLDNFFEKHKDHFIEGTLVENIFLLRADD